MSKTVPVEARQWRRGDFGTIWAVIEPHPTRRGFWICVSHVFSYDVESIGRRELERMPVVTNRDFFGKGKPHPGAQSVEAMRSMMLSVERRPS